MGFFNVSGEAEIHTVPKIWAKWISIVQEKYGKTQTFQIYGFLKYFGWSRNPYNSQNMGKVNFHGAGKVRENTNISNLWISWIFWVKQKSIRFPKYGESRFPEYRKSMGKDKHFKFMNFVIILLEAEIHTIPKTWGKWISIVRGKYGKTHTFQIYGFLRYLGWNRNP